MVGMVRDYIEALPIAQVFGFCLFPIFGFSGFGRLLVSLQNLCCTNWILSETNMASQCTAVQCLNIGDGPWGGDFFVG